MNSTATGGDPQPNSADRDLPPRVAELERRLARRVVVGIAGPPGAGKSTLAARLAERLGAEGIPTALLPMDGFHLPQAELVALGRRERMGAPDTFDVAGFAAALRAVRETDGPVRAPGFDRAIEEPVPGAVVVPAEARVVIAEGNYLLHDAGGWEGIRPLLDLTAYLLVDDGLRRRRLVARHVAFGKSPEAAEAWVREVDEPNAVLVARGLPLADLRVAVDPGP